MGRQEIAGSATGGSGPIAMSAARVSSDSKEPGSQTLSSMSRSAARLANSSISLGAANSANSLDAATWPDGLSHPRARVTGRRVPVL
ncbi:hypothetical protein [Micromonospora tulbaghiae]|uniref:hypothetical protein n=1 Tax=Micromonospora tulbaghiae TaxID=479978 RepID=UPI0033DFFA3F